MSFRDAIVNVLLNYGRFRGRATPRELACWLLAVIGATAVHLGLDGAVSAPLLGFAPFAPEAGRPLTVIGSLALLTPTLAVSARRLHDASRSAGWLWLLLVPGPGWLALGWMLTRPGRVGDNRYGPDVAGLYRT